MSSVKILHIVLGLQIGGLEKFVLDLVASYSSDFLPVVVCLEKKGELGEQFSRLQIIELSKSPGLSIGIVKQLVSLIKLYNIDIIHTHNPSPHFYGSLAGLLTGRPVIHTKHGRNYPTEKKKVLLNRVSSRLTTKVVAVSNDAADVCLEVERIPPSKVVVILNGINTTIFSPFDAGTNKKSLPIRIGIVARLAPEKDHQTLLQAIKIMATADVMFHLDIIGDGVLRSKLEKTVAEFGISSHVSFLGMKHDVHYLLKNLDVFVLSSTTEGISLTLLEAMATGLPVVATNVGGNPEVVIDGVTGYIVPAQAPLEMAEKLLLLLNDCSMRRQMGARGRERVVERFSIAETTRHYEELYRSVLSGR